MAIYRFVAVCGIAHSQFQQGFIAMYRFAETANSQFQHGFITSYCFTAVCGNSDFAVSARIYNDLLLCSGLWK